MVERLVANQSAGVRFSIPAQREIIIGAPARIRTWNSSSEDCCDIRFTTGACLRANSAQAGVSPSYYGERERAHDARMPS